MIAQPAMDRPPFPAELLTRQQWLIWKFVQKPGQKKPSKMPYYASGAIRTGQQGSEDDRRELVTYEEAVAAADFHEADGLGFAFLPGDGLIGIDIDGALNEDAPPERQQRAQRIIEACASYTEYSPSGNGVHIIVTGDTETFKSNELGIEVFCGRQFFTMSGKHYAGTPFDVSAISDTTLQQLRNTVKKQAEQAPAKPIPVPEASERMKMESALVFISPDCGYDDWIRVGMAIHAELGDAGLAIWDWWSARGTKYPGAREVESHYRSFKPGAITAGSLYRMAMDAGWRPPKPVAVAAPPAIAPAANDNVPAVMGDDDAAAMVSEWVFVSALRKFIHKPTMRMVDVDAFNLEHLHLMEQFPQHKKMKPSVFVRGVMNCEVVHDLMYLPTMWNGDPLCFLDGIRYLNTYNESGIPKTDPNWREHDAWEICLRHIQNILPDDWEQLLLWMAHNVQHPGKKILWAPVIVGMPGDGKTATSNMLAAAMGRKHAQVVGTQALHSEFNGWAEGKCLTVFEEIRVPGHSRHDFMNKLKALITNDVVDVVAKGKNSKNVLNTQNYIALSNFRDALVLDPDDRRWGVFFTRFQSAEHVQAEMDAAYWAQLNDYAIRDNPGVIRGWLQSIDLTGFNRNERPPMTSAKKFMIGRSMSSDAQSIDALLQIGAKGVSHDVVETRSLNVAMRDFENRTVQTSRMSAALSELKFTKVPGTIKWEGRPCHVWVRKPFEYDGSADAKARIRAALDQHEPLPPFTEQRRRVYTPAGDAF